MYDDGALTAWANRNVSLEFTHAIVHQHVLTEDQKPLVSDTNDLHLQVNRPRHRATSLRSPRTQTWCPIYIDEPGSPSQSQPLPCPNHNNGRSTPSSSWCIFSQKRPTAWTRLRTTAGSCTSSPTGANRRYLTQRREEVLTANPPGLGNIRNN